MPALKWLRLLLNHIPDKYEHLVHYYGYYSNRSRGARRLIDNGDGIARILNHGNVATRHFERLKENAEKAGIQVHFAGPVNRQYVFKRSAVPDFPEESNEVIYRTGWFGYRWNPDVAEGRVRYDFTAHVLYGEAPTQEKTKQSRSEVRASVGAKQRDPIPMREVELKAPPGSTTDEARAHADWGAR